MKKKIKALIIDDERLARNSIKSLLKKYNSFEVVAEAESVAEAIIKIKKHLPDILFLDIQMPGDNGFDLLRQIEYSGQIIFVTAFDEYAIRAFQVNALDYLLKPVSPERFATTINRILSKEKMQMAHTLNLNYDDRIFISIANCYSFVSLNEVKAILAYGDYTKLILDRGRTGIILRSMKKWEEKLPENHFTRIHRSSIVNINFIEKIVAAENHTLNLYLKEEDEHFVVSRSYRKRIKNLYK